MRATLLGTLLIALLGALVWFVAFRRSDVTVPVGDPAAEARADARLEPKPAELGASRAVREGPPDAGTAAARPTPAQPEPTPSASEGWLVVKVVDRATKAPLPHFKTLLRSGGPRQEREARDGEARLAVALDREAELTIEAEGYTPHGPERVEVHNAERTRTLTIELVRAVALSGVVLTVTDGRETPMPRIALTTWSFAADGTRTEPPLWQRFNEAADGVYRVPDLAPGRFRFEIVALDEKGDPLPWLPATPNVDFRGGEEVPVRVQLTAGGLVRVVVKDGGGQPLGTDVLLRLRNEVEPLDVRWCAREAGTLLVRRGGLPAVGEARLERAIAPGRYVLEVARGSAAPISRDFVLAAGETVSLEIPLP